jgi:hypothetical protein
MFLIVFYVFLAMLLFAGVGKGYSELQSKKTYALSKKEVKKFSWASKQLIQEYNALPDGNRPLGDITYPLSALDTKYGGAEKVTKHFAKTRNGYEHSYTDYRWHNCNCRYDCKMKDYKEMHDGIAGIKSALATQEHAMLMAGVESGLSEAASIAERLRQERELIEDTTKELTAR